MLFKICNLLWFLCHLKWIYTLEPNFIFSFIKSTLYLISFKPHKNVDLLCWSAFFWRSEQEKEQKISLTSQETSSHSFSLLYQILTLSYMVLNLLKKSFECSNASKCSKYLNTKYLPDPTSLKTQGSNSVFLTWKRTKLPRLVFGREFMEKCNVSEIEAHIISRVHFF